MDSAHCKKYLSIEGVFLAENQYNDSILDNVGQMWACPLPHHSRQQTQVRMSTDVFCNKLSKIKKTVDLEKETFFFPCFRARTRSKDIDHTNVTLPTTQS